MIFGIVVFLMVVLVAAFWAYQGLFSSAIMFFECLIACMIAFGFYEALNSIWVDSLGPGFGLPLALMSVFIISLVIMRVTTDRLIPGTVPLPLHADRAGGAIFGLFSGLILIGTALVGVQMLPLGSEILGFSRFSSDKEGMVVVKGISTFKPDSFTVGLVSMLSGGAFAADNRFATAKPDYVIDLSASRDTPQTEERLYLPADAISVLAYWDARPNEIDVANQKVEDAGLIRQFSSVGPAPLKKFLVCKVRISATSATENSKEIRFRVPQFRIVGPPPSASPGGPKPAVYPAAGMADIYTHRQHDWVEVEETQRGRLVKFSPQTDFILGPNQTKVLSDGSDPPKFYEVDVAFEVPEDFKPWYLEFKRGARFELDPAIKKNKDLYRAEPPDDAAVAMGDGTSSHGGEGGANKPTVGAALGGLTHIANAVEERTGASELLPYPIRRGKGGFECRGKKLVSGQGWLALEESDKIPAGEQVTEFAVPANKRLVQIGVTKTFPGSVLGQALNYAASVAGQTSIRDDQGRAYMAVGQYAMAPLDGEIVVEIQYWGDIEEGADVRLKRPLKLTANAMRNMQAEVCRLGFLFFVEEDAKRIVEFSPAGAKKPQAMNVDLTEE